VTAVPAQAWPYAVARGKVSGYQAIVVPGFLADAGLTYLLEYASEGEAGEPGAATVREVIGTSLRPLSVVYRVVVARASRYGLGGDEPLRDQAGRIIRVFEGLVLRLPAGQVASLGLTLNDLEGVTDVSVPAFRRLWTALEAIDAEPATAIAASRADPGTGRLSLRLAEPYVVPGERPPVRRPPVRRPGVPHPAGPRPARTRLIAVGAGVCVLALLGWLVASLVSPSPAPPPFQATVNQLCADLKTGLDEPAYHEFSPHYQQSATLAEFKERLLESGNSATCASTSVHAATDEATLSLRLADGDVKTVDLDMASQSGKWQVTAMKVTP
jgi:hypothetical protein